jgi:hypothetical protein
MPSPAPPPPTPPSGRSRSAAVVAALIMRAKQLEPYEALTILRRPAPWAAPNPGFLGQLGVWADMGWRLDARHPSYRAFQLEQVTRGKGGLRRGPRAARAPSRWTAAGLGAGGGRTGGRPARAPQPIAGVWRSWLAWASPSIPPILTRSPPLTRPPAPGGYPIRRGGLD